MIDEPVLTTLSPQCTAVIHLQIPRETIQQEMKPAIDEVLTVLAGQGLAPVGPLFTRHLCLSDTHFDFEVGFPINAPIEEKGRVYNSQLPGGQVVQTLYQGPYENLYAAWRSFGGRLESFRLPNGEMLRRGAGLWESYLTGPESSTDPNAWRTLLVVPLNES